MGGNSLRYSLKKMNKSDLDSNPNYLLTVGFNLSELRPNSVFSSVKWDRGM